MSKVDVRLTNWTQKPSDHGGDIGVDESRPMSNGRRYRRVLVGSEIAWRSELSSKEEHVECRLQKIYEEMGRQLPLIDPRDISSLGKLKRQIIKEVKDYNRENSCIRIFLNFLFCGSVETKAQRIIDWIEIKEKMIEGIAKDNAFKFTLPENLSPATQKLAQILFGEVPDRQTIAADKEFVDAFLKAPNLRFCEECRTVFKSILEQIYSSRPSNIFAAEALIGNLMCYIAYTRPSEEDRIKIPYWNGTEWDLVEYTIEHIRLTPDWMGPPSIAYGLVPVDNEQAPPRLLFKGTGFPSEPEFFIQVLNDITPLASVGSFSFFFGRDNIKDWLDKVGRGVWVAGHSLGGALTENVVSAFPSQVARGDAYCPPALLRANTPHSNMHVYIQPNDIVSCDGLTWGKGWKIYQVETPEHYNMLISHAKCHLIDPHCQIIPLDPAKESYTFSRILLTASHQIAAIPLFVAVSIASLARKAFKTM